jgi:hypothetical protein
LQEQGFPGNVFIMSPWYVARVIYFSEALRRFFMKSIFLACLILVGLPIACNNRRSTDENISGNDVLFSNNLIPKLNQLDSVELIYYKTVDNPRFFTFLPSKDTSLIRLIKQNASIPPSIGSRCKKGGKLYCFAKGNVFETFHFAYSGDSCNVITFVKNGRNYFQLLSPELKAMLIQKKKEAVEPQPGNDQRDQ